MLKTTDNEIHSLLSKEFDRQSSSIELIASENYASSAVRAAQGSIATNKYAEGYIGNRYYGGCHYVDEIFFIVSRLGMRFQEGMYYYNE